ncbi:hypothetical protein [Leclercia pneumoniae]
MAWIRNGETKTLGNVVNE